MSDKQNKEYITFKDFYNSLDNEPISKEDFEEKFLKPHNDDISIEDIQTETIKETAEIMLKDLSVDGF